MNLTYLKHPLPFLCSLPTPTAPSSSQISLRISLQLCVAPKSSSCFRSKTVAEYVGKGKGHSPASSGEAQFLSQGSLLADRAPGKDKHHTEILEKLSISADGQDPCPTGKAGNNERQKDPHFLSLEKSQWLFYS